VDEAGDGVIEAFDEVDEGAGGEGGEHGAALELVVFVQADHFCQLNEEGGEDAVRASVVVVPGDPAPDRDHFTELVRDLGFLFVGHGCHGSQMPPTTEDEIEVMARIAKRMATGRREYGLLEIDTDKRDWLEEAIEEQLDLAVYLCCYLVKLKRARQEGPRVKYGGGWTLGPAGWVPVSDEAREMARRGELPDNLRGQVDPRYVESK
jgi:hypothetical protein